MVDLLLDTNQNCLPWTGSRINKVWQGQKVNPNRIIDLAGPSTAEASGDSREQFMFLHLSGLVSR